MAVTPDPEPYPSEEDFERQFQAQLPPPLVVPEDDIPEALEDLNA